MIETNFQKVLNFIISKKEGSENKPTKLGNVNFWHPIPGIPAGLCWDLPTNKWDAKSVQHDLNVIASDYWEELVNYLNK